MSVIQNPLDSQRSPFGQLKKMSEISKNKITSRMMVQSEFTHFQSAGISSFKQNSNMESTLKKEVSVKPFAKREYNAENIDSSS